MAYFSHDQENCSCLLGNDFEVLLADGDMVAGLGYHVDSKCASGFDVRSQIPALHLVRTEPLSQLLRFGPTPGRPGRLAR